MSKYLPIILFILSGILGSCKGKETGQTKNEDVTLSQSTDTTQPTVTQKVGNESVSFNPADFNDLKTNKAYDRFLAGNLLLTTGQVVCTDPMYRELGLPQSWTVRPGKYPVYLYIGLDGDFSGRVAYAELVIKEEVPSSWKMSLIPDRLLADSFEIEMNGMYPVENGLSSFADYETFKQYDQQIEQFYRKNRNGNFYDEVLAPLFQKNATIPKSSRGEDWVDYQPDQAKGNIIMFGSGLGDGLYPRYVGYDKNGNVVKLVTDFIRKAEGDDDE